MAGSVTDNDVHDNTMIGEADHRLAFWAQDWDGNSALAEFNATPGEEGATYLGDAEKTSVLSGAGMPIAP